MSRPVDDPKWATNTNYGAGPYSGNANKARPAAGVIAEGFDPGAGIPAEWINYLYSNHGQWLTWILNIPTTSSYSPQTLWQDASGNNRFLVDHNGLPGGKIVQQWEDWSGYTGGASLNSTTTPISGIAWDLTVGNGAGSNSIAIATPSSAYGSNSWTTTPGTNASDSYVIATHRPVFNAATFLDYVVEFDFQMSAVGANNVTFRNGLLSTAGPSPGNADGAYFEKASTDTNWKCITADGTTKNTIDSGVAPSAATFQRFRIEYHGSATAYGAVTILFFINGTKVATSLANPPRTSGTPCYTVFQGVRSAANAVTGIVGSVRRVSNVLPDPVDAL